MTAFFHTRLSLPARRLPPQTRIPPSVFPRSNVLEKPNSLFLVDLQFPRSNNMARKSVFPGPLFYTRL
jgi:hypothetical protein